MHINYYLKSAANGVTVRVYDGARMIAETTTAPGKAGLNTVRWTMQSVRPMTEAEQQAAADVADAAAVVGGGFGGARRRSRRRSPQFPAAAANAVMATVPPGEYRVVLSVGGREYTQTAQVRADSQ